MPPSDTSFYVQYLVADQIKKRVESLDKEVDMVAIFPSQSKIGHDFVSVSVHWEYGVDPDIKRRWAERFIARYGGEAVEHSYYSGGPIELDIKDTIRGQNVRVSVGKVSE